ncbi:MAG TPA: hypothetical protein VLU25_05065 [Acidobacteriota bacterium]|nr:hypothetical protein [Acidobacteriota bacterium]
MADAMDCGFDWTKPDIKTLTYGFSTNDSGTWKQRPGGSDTIDASHKMYFSFFETSETDPSSMTLKKVTISFQCKEGSVFDPMVGWGPARNQFQNETFEVDATGQEDGWSAGLQQHGTAWSLGPFSFNPELQLTTCTYEVRIAISVEDKGETRQWAVDPTLIIGGRD